MIGAELLEAVRAAEHPYVVVLLDEEAGGVRWRDQTKEACEVMAEVLGRGAVVVPRLEFLAMLRSLA